MSEIWRAAALVQLAQADAPAAPAHSPPNWIAYSSGEGIALAIVLIVAAAAFAYAGTRLRTPLSIARPGAVVAGFLIIIWLFSIADFLFAFRGYALLIHAAYPDFVSQRPRVGTFIDAPLTFLIIAWLTRRWGLKIAVASGILGACAAPMIFELPFDLIVMARTYPELPHHAMLYRMVFFLPLYLIEFSTFALLALLPTMRITSYACHAVAAMLAVFALWAAIGFTFPDEPLPLALNIVSKMLCFVAAILLFVWKPDDVSRPAPA